MAVQVCVAPANMDILAEYPQPVMVMFGSSAETGVFSNSAVPNGVPNTVTGYYEMMLACGQASSAPSTGEMIADPYPDRLRPIKGLKNVQRVSNLLFERMDFYGYDTTLTGAVGQDPLTLAAIANSLTATPNDAYMQSRFTNGLIGNWNPNWFAPIVKFDDFTVCDHTITDVTGGHLGHLSMGPPLPWGEDYRYIFETGFNNITIRCQLIQDIADSAGAKFQRYFVLCVMRFRKKLA